MLNKVQLIGHLGRDPEIRSMNGGGEVATLSVATSEHWNDKDGNRQSRTEWHKVVIFNEGLVKLVKTALHKGSKIYVEGQMQTRKWQDNRGEDRYSTEVVLQRFRGEMKLLDKKEQDPGASDYSGHQTGGHQTRTAPAPADLDDDVPF